MTTDDALQARSFHKKTHPFSHFEAPSPPEWPPAVETSIAVEDAVENRGLYRVLVSRMFQRGLRHYSATIARLSPLSGLERGG